jgi:hypothetical protein
MDGSEDLPVNLEDQVSFLNGVRALIPKLFIEATTYQVDMFELIQAQKELWATLEKMDTYKKHKKSKEQLLTIGLRLEDGEQTAVQRSIDPAAISAWKHDMLQILEGLSSNESIEGQLLSKMSAHASLAQSHQGLVSTILRLVPMSEQERSQLMRASEEEKADFLATRLNEVPNGFDFSRYPWIEQRDLKGLKEAVQKSRVARRTYASLLELHLLLQDSSNTIDDRLDTAKERINALGELDLDIFIDKDVFKKRLAVLGAKSTINPRFVTDLIGAHVNEISSKQVTTQAKFKNLSLHEVDHNLAMFRGMVTGDCSTEYSAGFSASPFERTFFIVDQDQRVEGTVSLTLLKDASGNQVAYVHTVAGKSLSSADVMMAFEGIRQLLPTLGAGGMVIPTSAQISALNNLSTSQSVFSDLATTRSLGQTSLKYQDSELRDEINKVDTAPYDMPSSNTEGTRMDVQNPIVDASPQNVVNRFKDFTPIPMKGAEFAILALDMLALGQKDMAQKIAKLGKVDFNQLESLDKIIQNKDQLTIAEYKQNVEEFFRYFGNDAGGLFDTHSYYFELGLLRAADSLSGENIKSSTEVFSSYLRLQGVPPLGKEWYEKANALGLGRSSGVRRVVAKLDPNDVDDLKLFLAIIQKLDISNEVTDGVVNQWHEAQAKPIADVIFKNLYPPRVQASLIRSASIEQLNQQNAHGFTPLMIAALNGQDSVFEALLARGVDTKLKNNDGDTALEIATEWGRVDMLKRLSGFGSDGSADLSEATPDNRSQGSSSAEGPCTDLKRSLE